MYTVLTTYRLQVTILNQARIYFWMQLVHWCLFPTSPRLDYLNNTVLFFCIAPLHHILGLISGFRSSTIFTIL